MPKTIIIHNRQSLLDIATEKSGTVESVFELARCNGDLSITDIPEVGGELKLPNWQHQNKEVKTYYERKSLKIATITIEE